MTVLLLEFAHTVLATAALLAAILVVRAVDVFVDTAAALSDERIAAPATGLAAALIVTLAELVQHPLAAVAAALLKKTARIGKQVRHTIGIGCRTAALLRTSATTRRIARLAAAGRTALAHGTDLGRLALDGLDEATNLAAALRGRRAPAAGGTRVRRADAGNDFVDGQSIFAHAGLPCWKEARACRLGR